MGDCVFSEENASDFLDFLYLERHKHRKALGGKGTHSVNLPQTNRENGI